MRPINQMLMDDDRLSAAELKELLIRHVRNNPFDSRNAPISDALVRAWSAAYMRDTGREPEVVSGQRAYDLMKEYFTQAFRNSADTETVYADDMWVWPVCLSNPAKYDIEYPTELLVLVGLAIGNEVGASIKASRAVTHHPKN